MRRRLTTILICAPLATLAAGAVPALGHGGDEMALEDLKMQPARTLAQQALVELRINGDVEDAAARLDAALESEDRSAVDLPVLRKAMETVDSGRPQAAIPLLDEALSRPQGVARGAALHEAGREFQPGTDTQEIVAIAAGGALVLLGLVALRPTAAR